MQYDIFVFANVFILQIVDLLKLSFKPDTYSKIVITLTSVLNELCSPLFRKVVLSA